MSKTSPQAQMQAEVNAEVYNPQGAIADAFERAYAEQCRRETILWRRRRAG
jgi:hypothetical protein